MQKINLKLDYMIDVNGNHQYNGKLSPHIDKIPTTFGGVRHDFEDGDIEEVLSIWPSTSELHLARFIQDISLISRTAQT